MAAQVGFFRLQDHALIHAYLALDGAPEKPSCLLSQRGVYREADRRPSVSVFPFAYLLLRQNNALIQLSRRASGPGLISGAGGACGRPIGMQPGGN